jgi:hypothetical protein
MAVGLILAVALFSIFFWTTLGVPTGSGDTRYLCLGSGGLDYLLCPGTSTPSNVTFTCSPAGSWSVLVWPNSHPPLGGAAISLPLWFAFIPLLLSAGIRAVRRSLVPAHLCRDCGYDNRGLPPGSPCPECGRRTNIRASKTDTNLENREAPPSPALHSAHA